MFYLYFAGPMYIIRTIRNDSSVSYRLDESLSLLPVQFKKEGSKVVVSWVDPQSVNAHEIHEGMIVTLPGDRPIPRHVYQRMLTGRYEEPLQFWLLSVHVLLNR